MFETLIKCIIIARTFYTFFYIWMHVSADNLWYRSTIAMQNSYELNVAWTRCVFRYDRCLLCMVPSCHCINL